MKNITEIQISERAGFTLAEVLIVVVILGVLAGLAIPSYTNSIEQSRANEAQANLNIIYTAEKIYKVNNGTFWAPPGTPIVVGSSDPSYTSDNSVNYKLNIDLAPPEFYPIASIVAAGSGDTATFTATATRNGGGWVGRSASINEAGFYRAP